MFRNIINNADDENEDVQGLMERDLRTTRWRWWYAIVIILILFPYVTIPILFAMISQCDGGDSTTKKSTTNNYYVEGYSTSSVSTDGSSSIGKGTVVSLTNTGDIQAGAGTSIYQSAATPSFSNCPSYVSMAAVSSDLYIISYLDSSSATPGTLQLVSFSDGDPSAGEVVDTEEYSYQFFEIISMSQEDMTFIAICQDLDEDEDDSYVIAGQITNNGQSITLGDPLLYVNTQYSVDPVITRLSDTEFAIMFYKTTDSSSTVRVKFGTLNSDLTVDFIGSTEVVDDPSHSHYFTAVGISSTQAVLVYYNASVPDTEFEYYGYGPLTTVLATAVDGNDIILSDTVTLENSAAIFGLAATVLDDDTVVVAYANPISNYGIQTQVIQVQAQLNSSTDEYEEYLVFGSSWAVTSGLALTVQPAGSMDLDIVTISNEGDFMLLYSDASNEAIMTATMGKVTSSGEFARTSADVLLNDGNTDLESVYSWGALAAGVTTKYSTQAAILFALSDTTCSNATESTFSMLEILPTPYGVTAYSSSSVEAAAVENHGELLRSRQLVVEEQEGMGRSLSSSKTVYVGGTMAGWNSLLTKGYVYYANTKGELIQGPDFFGREGSKSAVGVDSNSASGFYYFYDSVSDTFIMEDSRVGFALSGSKLYVLPQ